MVALHKSHMVARLDEPMVTFPEEQSDAIADGRVTVLIPTRDRPDLVEQTIDSVLAQTRLPDRIVVVDNSQRDPEAIRLLSSRSGVQYLPPIRNLSMNENHQRALAFGRSEFICILQDDDLYRPRFIEVCVEVLEKDPEASLVAVNYAAIDQNGSETAERSWAEFHTGRHEPAEFFHYVMGNMSQVHLSASVFRRSAAVSTGFAEVDTMVSDMGLFFRIAQFGPVHLLNEPLSAIRIHPSQTSTVNGWFNDIAFTLVPIEFAVKDRFLRSPGAISLLGDTTVTLRHIAASRARDIYRTTLRQRRLPMAARWKLVRNIIELEATLRLW